jgi:hypothetical protein
MDDFTLLHLHFDNNIFNELANQTLFEPITTGRDGANIMNMYMSNENLFVPIVRTTTKYKNPNQHFTKLHYDIIDQIQSQLIHLKINHNCHTTFNNALIEIYDNKYTTMGYHSDQSLDLCDNSYIAIFSCYKFLNSSNNLRKLIIKNKSTNELREILLEHNSVLIFSAETNKKYLHKIILDNTNSDTKSNNENQNWLGITFRLSKTNICFDSSKNLVCLENNSEIKLASESNEKEFYKMRGLENKLTDFSYPPANTILYTISMGDLIRPDVVLI